MSNIVESKKYTYFELKSAIYTLAESYPFVRVSSVGKSVLGKELLTLSVGKGKESVLLCGAFHGSEALTATLILSFAERLFAALEGDGEVAGICARRALFGRKLVFLPMVNPDGCDISVTERADCGPFRERGSVPLLARVMRDPWLSCGKPGEWCSRERTILQTALIPV